MTKYLPYLSNRLPDDIEACTTGGAGALNYGAVVLGSLVAGAVHIPLRPTLHTVRLHI